MKMGLIPTGTWPTPQNAKGPYLKFRERTHISPLLKGPHQLRFLENCPPTPPLSQHFALSDPEVSVNVGLGDG